MEIEIKKLWLREGDRNTSFFHKYTVQHRQQNKIYRLKARDGTILEEQRPIEQELIRYYSELLSKQEDEDQRSRRNITQHIPKLVTQDHNSLLMRPIEWEEVEEAVMQMEKGTAPGPNGFTVDFYQFFWDLVKEEVWEIVEESRKSKRNLKAFNATFLTLIPKEQGAFASDKFRPISLCNVILKIITKVIANHLKPLLPLLISS